MSSLVCVPILIEIQRMDSDAQIKSMWLNLMLKPIRFLCMCNNLFECLSGPTSAKSIAAIFPSKRIEFDSRE